MRSLFKRRRDEAIFIYIQTTEKLLLLSAMFNVPNAVFKLSSAMLKQTSATFKESNAMV